MKDSEFKGKSRQQTDYPSIKDFEEVLSYVGGWGRYQFILLLFFFAFCAIDAYVVYSPVLFLYVPDHWCKPHPSFQNTTDFNLEQILNLTVPWKDTGKREQCFMYNITLQEALDTDDSSLIAMEQIPCQYGYDYNITDYFSTIVTELDWVCQDSWRGPFTQSLFFVGGILGTLIFGYSADRFGRFSTFLTSNILMFIFGIATPFCNDFISFCTIRFLMGITFDTTIRSFFLLALELVSIDKRSTIGTLSFAIGFTFGGSYIAWLIKYLKDWKIFHHILFAQSGIIFIAPFFLHESVRWLATQGKIEESKKVLAQIAKINGKQLSENFFKKYEEMVERENRETDRSAKMSWLDLFKTPELRKNSILMIITWMMISGLFDGHIRNTSNLTSSFYVTFTIAALLELPSDLCVIWGLENIGRRWSVFFSLLFSGLAMIVCGFFTDYGIVVGVFCMIGRFWMTYAMSSGQQYVFEVFPTSLRAQGNALATVFSLASQFFSPYVAYSAVVTPGLPFYILGIGGILGAIISVFLPETAGIDLPHTIEQAETFAKDLNFLFVPILEVKFPNGPNSRHSSSANLSNMVNGQEENKLSTLKGQDNMAIEP